MSGFRLRRAGLESLRRSSATELRKADLEVNFQRRIDFWVVEAHDLWDIGDRRREGLGSGGRRGGRARGLQRIPERGGSGEL